MSADEMVPADAIEQQLARDMLGPYVDAPTAQLLLPQARQMPQVAWQIIRNALEQNPQARDDINCLTELLATGGQVANGINTDRPDTSTVAEPSDFSIKPADRLPLTDECHHYTGKHEVPWDIQKLVSCFMGSWFLRVLIELADTSANGTQSSRIMIVEFT